MSYNGRASSSYRHTLNPGASTRSSSGGNAALVTRIQEKQKELENLLQMKELSATLAEQMVDLESKLETLADGTDGVAKVLANWQNVFRAINLATAKLHTPEEAGDAEPSSYPERLVRLPTGK